MIERDYTAALVRAASHARSWLDGIDDRPVPPSASVDDVARAVGGQLPAEPTPAADVVDLLAGAGERGLMGIQSGRFFGWVMGGTLPAALGADWLVSAWDQNAGMRSPTPAISALEDTAASWLLDLLGLPHDAGVGFVTGATMANFTGLAAARGAVLARAGWDVNSRGLTGAPPLHVLVGAERHDTVDLALRYLGLGRPTAVDVDSEGRIDPGALERALAAVPSGAAIIVCLQAGNLHSGAFDPFEDAIAMARARGAWVHVDGAFGLWAAASPQLRRLTAGVAGADSWATDAHKTLNVPYDCGIAVVADRAALRAALGVHASYLPDEDDGPGNPFERVPELSRRARGEPVWAALRSLGRSGTADLVEGLAAHARAIADGVDALDGVHVVNQVEFTQVCLAFDDRRVASVAAALVADGRTWMSASSWRGRDVLRISVSNWRTDRADVECAVDAIAAAVAATTPD